MYKCIPDSHHLPNFIVPYDNKCIQFRKRPLNKYILFCFKEWKDKHPVGMITHVLGDVDKLEVFYDYQLHCKSLMDSIKDFNKHTLEQTKSISNIEDVMPQTDIEDRRERVIFSIDPEGCKDIDDAMGIVTTPTGYIISIYIANVTIWMEYLKLWNVFSERISTIYLPDRRVSMLPTILSEHYASLKEGVDRFAFCMDLHISQDEYMIEKIEYKNVLVRLDINYAYDEKVLLENLLYRKIMEITKELTKITNYLDTVTNSHEVVEFWMIMMNHQCGLLLECHKTGLFRTKQEEPHDDDKDKDREIDTEIDIENKNIFKIWNSTSAASYCSYENNKGHDMIGKTGLDTYVHITSPIRRLVDLINMTTIQKKLGLMKCSDESERFLTKWYSRIDYINQKMKAIKQVQNDCALLYLCSSGSINMEEELSCYVWRNDNDNMNIYIPSIKWITNIQVETDKKYRNYSLQRCKVFVINDEVSLKRKVRIMIT